MWWCDEEEKSEKAATTEYGIWRGDGPSYRLAKHLQYPHLQARKEAEEQETMRKLTVIATESGLDAQEFRYGRDIDSVTVGLELDRVAVGYLENRVTVGWLGLR